MFVTAADSAFENGDTAYAEELRDVAQRAEERLNELAADEMGISGVDP